MSQSRRFELGPATSGLPQSTDIARPARLVRFVPIPEVHSFKQLRADCKNAVLVGRPDVNFA
jgi:hypothetical protein